MTHDPSASFVAVPRQSLADAVFAQLSERILHGGLAAGQELPAERFLAEQLGINRGAVREGLKRLQQAGLVAVRHGGATQVLDWRSHAGLEVLPQLLVDAGGRVSAEAVRGIMALRSTLAPAVAAEAARHRDPKLAERLEARVQALRAAPDASGRQVHAMAFWSAVVAASGNLAYQLAFNSLERTYRPIWNLLTQVMDVEFRDIDTLAALASAIRAGDADEASARARAHVALGEAAIAAVLKPKKRSRSA